MSALTCTLWAIFREQVSAGLTHQGSYIECMDGPCCHCVAHDFLPLSLFPFLPEIYVSVTRTASVVGGNGERDGYCCVVAWRR